MADLRTSLLVASACLSLCLPLTSSKGTAICPNDLPCNCTIDSANGQHALRIDCSKVLKETGEIPDLTGIKSSQIKYLNLSHNNIKEIKADVLGLNFDNGEDAAQLILDGNPLEDISAFAFRGIKGEVDLSIKSCGLEEIPLIALTQIKELKKLSLASNKIDILPENAFSEFNKLVLLDLSKNSLSDTNFADQTFGGLEDSLEEVNLAHCSLTSFPSEALKPLRVLREINLNRNDIKELPAYIFHNFSSDVKKMSVFLNENKMTDIDVNAFTRNKTKLEIIDLTLWDNELDNVDFLAAPCSSVIAVRKASILLSANPLYCDCTLFDIIRTGYSSVKGRCEAPVAYKDVLVDVLYGNDLDPRKARYAGDFGKKAEATCPTANLTDTDLSCVGEPKMKPSTNAGSMLSQFAVVPLCVLILMLIYQNP
jgi:hypothetical protein